MIIDHRTVKLTARNYLQSRQVPRNLFGQTFDLTEYADKIEQEHDGKLIRVRPEQQMRMFENTLAKPLKDPYLYAIGTMTNELRAQAVGLKLFRAGVRAYYKNRAKYGSAPYWYTVFGGYRDRLRDDQAFREQLGNFSMLLLGNIAINSTDEKIQKVRDLLYMYADIPRVVVVVGSDPLTFFREKIYMRPTRLLYLGERRVSL